MKVTVPLIVLICSIVLSEAQLLCDHRKPDVPKDWIDMARPCVHQVRNQVSEELRAALQYLAMGAHFARDTVNRPGFAKLFFEAASEERGHAIQMIEYLLLRGELTSNVNDLIKRNLFPSKVYWQDGTEALSDALKLEASVTKKIRKIIKVCEEDRTFDDYQAADYFTQDFLLEQYKGERNLAGKLSTLEKMKDQHGILGEWLFDKQLA